QGQALEALRADQFLLRTGATALLFRFAQGTPYGGRQSRRVVLEDVIRGAVAQRLDGGFLTQGGGNEDEGYGSIAFAQQLQGPLTAEGRQAEIGQHDMRVEPVEAREERRLVVDEQHLVVEPVLLQLGLN